MKRKRNEDFSEGMLYLIIGIALVLFGIWIYFKISEITIAVILILLGILYFIYYIIDTFSIGF